MKLNGWQRLWVVIVLLWGVSLTFNLFFLCKSPDTGIELDLFGVFLAWLLVPSIVLYLFGWLIGWVFRGRG